MSKGSATGEVGGFSVDWREAGLWSMAGLVVVVLHAGGAWYLQSRQTDELAGDIAPAVAIDMVPLPAPIVPEPVKQEAKTAEPEPTEPEALEQETAVPEALTDVEPESEEQPARVEEAEPVEEVTPEPVDPEPGKDEAEEVVELPQVDVPLPVVRPEPERAAAPKKDVVRRPVRKPAVAKVETERPRKAVEQPRSSVSSAASARQAEKWSDRVRAYLVRRTRSARMAGKGTVRISIGIARSGEIVSASVVGSSGTPQLDQSVLDIIRRSSPVPSAPDDVTMSRMGLTVPFLIR